MTETYYDRLGVTPEADQSEIKAQWKQAVKEKHPDQNDDPDAQQQFIQLKEAYDVLSDPEERERYDRLGHEQYVGGRQHGGTDTGDAYQRDRTTRDGTGADDSDQGRAGQTGDVDWGAHTRGHEAAEHVWKAGSGPTADTAPPTGTAHAGVAERTVAYGGLVLIPGFLSVPILQMWANGAAVGALYTAGLLLLTAILIAGAETVLDTERRIWNPFG
ncbi:J domain-containing protein [Haloarcula onubensis]|uniref:J domain-containing protein n=1 Tax=Haloarcula onubensis TaxID=2950539 RepID=A0ABU2FQ37_9EURY|nr:J domain-containing protein [Halomicroarcula sp. S3CR25-11]MDS0282867.1 J domain-containing protein [Halomicroarcula sp. S3CR25-11]